VLLSDRDLRAEITTHLLVIDTFAPQLVQPSSVDVRLNTLFRVFNNTLFTHNDPPIQLDELTSRLRPKPSPSRVSASAIAEASE